MRRWISVLLLTLVCFRGVYAGDDIHGSARLYYRSTEKKTAQEKESSWNLNQTYDLGLIKEFTPKVNFTANVGINVTETDDTKTTRLYPDMRLNVSNEYFRADTGYQLVERGLDILTMVSDEDRYTTESWNTNFYTKPEKYPKLRLRYNQDKSYDHLSVHQTNNRTNRFSGSADYAYRFLNLYYNYINTTSDDYVADSTVETNMHEGRVDFRRSFWTNKVASSGSYSIKETKTETQARGKDIEVDEKKPASDGLYKKDTGDAINVTLDSEPLLIDGDKATSTGINIGDGSANDDQNIGLEFTFSSEVEKIYLYTTTPDTNFNKNNFQWDVYSSSDNSTWTLIKDTASFDYDTTQERFEISFTKTSARYFKVVNDQNDSYDLFVTEIEAYAAKTQAAYTTAEDVDTTETIHANLGFRPFDWLSFTYDLNQDLQKSESGTDSTKTRRLSQNISGLVEKGFKLHKYLEVRPQYQRRLEYEDESETETRRSTDTYRVHFLSSPLKTLDADFSLNHRVVKEDSKTQSRDSSALLHTSAKLRDGVDLDIDADITRNENFLAESELISRFINSNLRLELTSALTTEIEYNMTWSNTEAPGGDTSGRNSHAETTVYWRPSHDFYLRGSYSIDRDEEAGKETSGQDFDLNWLLTEKIQLTMGYGMDRNDTVQTSYSSDLSWSLSRTFTLRFAFNWNREEADTETETQVITADLSARF